MPFDPGTYAGHYELLGLIGVGGMGEVYKARDTHLHRTVAVKVLPAQLADNPDRVARFAHEARTASALNHPNIVTIHEIGDIAGAPYLVMELVEGQTLRRLMTEGAIDARRTLDIATQVADGLAKAHAAGIVHRDLKPENIMVTQDGFAKILDFGLAKLRGDAAERVDETVTQTAPRTVAGTILGTVGYMSPEQAAGRPVAVQSDQFALGTIVYEMATGRRAFERDSAVQTLAAIIEDEPEPIAALSPAFPESARQIVERCLSKDPDARYGSTLDLARELRGVREQLSQTATAGPQKRAKAEAAWMGRSRRLPALAVVAALLMAAIVSAALYFSRGHVESIAVLPFKNLTGDSTQEYFVDGITDGLIGHLGRVSALRVLSFYSVMRYKEGKTPLAQVAQTLNADTLVEGSVQEVGSNVSVRVRLISPRPEERTLWEGTYSRTITDTLVMYGDVVRAISRELDVPLQASEEARLTQPRQVNPKTYQAYLRGMFLLNGSTDEEFEQGLSILEQAVRDDPGDPLTYVGLADAYVTLGHGPTSTPDAWQRARQAAQRALRIDPNLAEAYANLADVKLYYERDWKGAEQNFKRAMELNANLPMNHYHYAWYLALFSRWDEAIAEHKRAQELDPLTPLHTGWLGGLYWYVGRYDEALREAGKCLKLRNRSALGWLITGYAHVEQGHFDEAIAAHQKAVAISPDWRYALARSYAMAGKREEARKIEAELEREKPSDFGAWGLAVVATALGEHDKAFKWLDYQPAHGWVPWCRVDPQFRPLRNDPRFKALLRKFNLPDVNDRSS